MVEAGDAEAMADYLFDLRGYRMLEGALSPAEVAELVDWLDLADLHGPGRRMGDWIGGESPAAAGNVELHSCAWPAFLIMLRLASDCSSAFRTACDRHCDYRRPHLAAPADYWNRDGSNPSEIDDGVNLQHIYEGGPCWEALLDHPSVKAVVAIWSRCAVILLTSPALPPAACAVTSRYQRHVVEGCQQNHVAAHDCRSWDPLVRKYLGQDVQPFVHELFANVRGPGGEPPPIHRFPARLAGTAWLEQLAWNLAWLHQATSECTRAGGVRTAAPAPAKGTSVLGLESSGFRQQPPGLSTSRRTGHWAT